MLRVMLMWLVLSLSSLASAADQPEPLVLQSYGDAYRAMQKHNVPGIFVFQARWCGPCHQMKRDVWTPLMPQLKTQYIIYFVDIDVEKDVAKKWKEDLKLLSTLPAYAIITNGATGIVAFSSGYKDQATFVRWMNTSIDNWYKKPQPPSSSPIPGKG